jgi:hypothetical protein
MRKTPRLFPATEFLVEVLQHLPDAGAMSIRRYGLYSSRSRGTPCPAGACAPRGWPRSGQREPFAPYPLRFPDAGPCRHYRSPAGPQDPPPPHQDHLSPPGTGRRFSRMTLRPPCGPRSLSPPLCASTRHLLNPSRRVSCALTARGQTAGGRGAQEPHSLCEHGILAV